jgi:PleD family two-component response regulator
MTVRKGVGAITYRFGSCLPEKVNVVLSRLSPFKMDLDGKAVSVSSSQGWVQYQPPETLEQLISRADETLYEDKRSHREGLLEGLNA